MSSKWLPLESNPEMLTTFIRSLGVATPTHFVDLWSFDPETLSLFPQPMVAVCLLYPSDVIDSKRTFKESQQFKDSDLIYIRQRPEQHGNACGSIAVTHAICNNTKAIHFLPNSPLFNFAKKCHGFTPDQAADALQNATDLHSATAVAAAEGQTETPDAEDEVNHHFICFLVFKGVLLELDGMKPTPISHGPCSPENLLEHAMKVIREDMMSKDPTNVHFSALGLTLAEEES